MTKTTFIAETPRGTFTRSASTGRRWSFIVISGTLRQDYCDAEVARLQRLVDAGHGTQEAVEWQRGFYERARKRPLFVIGWSETRKAAEARARSAAKKYESVEVFEAREV